MPPDVATSIGYNYRHAPAVERIREVIANGDLGRITNVRAVFFNGYASEPNGALSWRFKKDLAGSGALGDLLSHVVDLVQYVVGPITDVTALLSTVHQQRPILPMGSGTHFAVIEDGELGDVENDDYVGALVRFAAGSPGAGAVGTLEASRVIVGPQCGLGFEIYGTEGSASWNFERMNELQLSIGRTGPNQGYTTILGNQSQGDYAHFQPGPGNAMGYDDLKVIEAKKFLVAVTGGEQLQLDHRRGPGRRRGHRGRRRVGGRRAVAPGPRDPRRHLRPPTLARSRSCLSRCRWWSGSASSIPPWSPRCSPVGAASSPTRPTPTCGRLRGPSPAPTPTSTPPSSTGPRGCGSSRGPASAWNASTWTPPPPAGSRSWSPPAAGAVAVAEGAIAMAMHLVKRFGRLTDLVRSGRWADRGSVAVGDLAGSTLGVVGFGRIGQHAGTLGAALGMKVLAYDPVAEPPAACRCGTLAELLSRSDVITLHLPLTPDTHHLIDAETLALTKPGAILVNCGRGSLIDNDAAYQALLAGRIAGIGLDVFDPEPPQHHPLFDHPDVVLTPHLMGLSRQATAATFTAAATGVVDVLEGREPAAVANPHWRQAGLHRR